MTSHTLGEHMHDIVACWIYKKDPHILVNKMGEHYVYVLDDPKTGHVMAQDLHC